MSAESLLITSRLSLVALTASALEAWIEADATRLSAETGVQFVDPVEVPPLFGEDMPMFRDRMIEAPGDLGWWVWLAATRVEDRPVGVCGLGGRPDNGMTMLGYSVYPAWEGCGYATEASAAVVAWALAQPGCARVRATVPIANAQSLGVARKLGMLDVGREHHPEVGALAVFEIVQAGPTT